MKSKRTVEGKGRKEVRMEETEGEKEGQKGGKGLRTSKMSQLEMSSQPIQITIVRSLGTIWCKYRTNSQKFSAILHTHKLIYVHACTHAHTKAHKQAYAH